MEGDSGFQSEFETELEDTTNIVRQRVLEFGFLSEDEVEFAHQGYQASGMTTFASYLLRQNLITLEQLAEMAPKIPSKVESGSALSDREIGRTYSGCVIERLLGRGGMGSVYLARRESDDAPIVVKVLAPECADKEDLVARFRREGEVLRRIPSHPNLVGVPDVSEDQGEPHILMDYVEGLSLERILEERWSLPPMAAARVVRDIARGLAVVHEHGIIHRDLKPANVLVTPEGVVKIVDFGLAKDLFADGLTLPGMRLGTPYYMAPEQWGDHEVDARCDMFALGATFYHLVVGEPPFLGAQSQEIGELIMAGEFTTPRRIVPDLSQDLELVIIQMMLSDRRFRYASMTECADDLDLVLEGGEPTVPALFHLDDEGARKRRYPLIPGKSFTIGREIDSDVIIPDPSVSRRHAGLRRESNGYVLRDMGSSFGCYVNGMRVRRPVVLKSKDAIRLGRVDFEFCDPIQLDRESQATQDVLRLRAPEPIIEALLALGDKRVSLTLLERLTLDPVAQVEVEQLNRLLGEDVGRVLADKLRRKVSRSRTRAPMLLFSITAENLGNDVPAWLAWWDAERTKDVTQVGAERPAHLVRLRVVAGEAAVSDLALDDLGGVFHIGRDENNHLPLSNRTVSRLHATIFRLHRRWVIRDEGSRLGTLVNGERVRLSFLNPGDTIQLGSVEMSFELQEHADESLPAAGIGLFGVSPDAFDALVDMKHESTVTALMGFLYEARRAEWVQWHAAALFPANDEEAQRLLQVVARFYSRRAELATELLPELLGSSTLSDWPRLLAERRTDLGPQVLPLGWLASSRGLQESQVENTEETR
jgi:serine/threonine protein kinase